MKNLKIVTTILLLSLMAGLPVTAKEKPSNQKVPQNNISDPGHEMIVPQGDENAPVSIEYVDFGKEIVPPADQPLVISVRFHSQMDNESKLIGKLSLPGVKLILLQEGKWNSEAPAKDRNYLWTFEPITSGLVEGIGTIELGGAQLKGGVPVAKETYPICIGKKPILDRLRYLADTYNYSPYIFVQGYIYRAILALYEMTGEERYLDMCRKWVHQAVAQQMDNGFWDTGYGEVYFADTGSALGMLINFYKFATADEKKLIDSALEKYVSGMLVMGDSRGTPFVHDDGSLGVGIRYHKDTKKKKDSNCSYSISTALTGAEVFAALYYLTGSERYKYITIRASDWLLNTMLPNGQFPYIIDIDETGTVDKYERWNMWPYDTAGYIGEGLIAAWTYIDDEDFRRRLGQRLEDHIEWLLHTQNYDGTWAEKQSEDQQRSHGVVNLLLWYHHNIKKDPRIIRAIQKYYLLMLDEQRSQYLYIPRYTVANPILTMRALADIISPGIDCYRWKEPSATQTIPTKFAREEIASTPPQTPPSPMSIEYVDFGPAIIPQPGEKISVTVKFYYKMDPQTQVRATLSIPGAASVLLDKGSWDSTQRFNCLWRFEPVILGLSEGVGTIELSGAKDSEGRLMFPETFPLCVGNTPILQRLKELAVSGSSSAICVQGYINRSLLALYELTNDKKYLDQAQKWVDAFIAQQMENGYWDSGYGHIFLADTGSALAALFNVYQYARPEEKEKIEAALQKYIDALFITGDDEGSSFVHEDGSLGIGFTNHKDEKKKQSKNQPYTISTGLTGAQIFAGMYYMTGNDIYKNIAVNACDWLLDTMLPNGQIADYVYDLNPGLEDKIWVWHRWPYDVATYAGEGFIAAWTYIDDVDFRRNLGERLEDHIEWLLRTQNYDGSWAVKGSQDQQRSHGVVNLLLWYHRNIKKDPRIVRAVQKFYLLILDKERCRYLNVPRQTLSNSILMRALVDIIQPGIDCRRWKE